MEWEGGDTGGISDKPPWKMALIFVYGPNWDQMETERFKGNP